MKRNFSDYLVALAVLACSGVLLAALTFALSGYRVKKPTRTLDIDFIDVAGIKLHSELRYAGASAGRVIAMRHLTADERAGGKYAVRVSVSINEEVPPLPADVKASLGSDTLLSEKFVALSAGNPQSGTMKNGETIQAQAGSSIDQIVQSAGPILDNANELLNTLRNELSAVLPKISTLADATGTVAQSAESLLKHVDKFLSNNEGELHARLEELKGVIKNMDDVLAKGGEVLNKTSGFVGSTDQTLNARMKELRVVLENLKVVSTHAKAITQTLGEKPSRLIWSSKANKLTPEAEILKSSETLPATVPQGAADVPRRGSPSNR